MQFQHNLLTHLGHARIEMFKTFCLPSIVQQTTDNFSWIIRSFAQILSWNLTWNIKWLSSSVLIQKKPLLVITISMQDVDVLLHQMISSMNIMCFGKYEITSWSAWSGTIPRAVLETRLEADGLHRKFVQHIQKEALTLFGWNKYMVILVCPNPRRMALWWMWRER